MFGRRYFGGRMFGPRYWGDGGAGAPPAPSADLVATEERILRRRQQRVRGMARRQRRRRSLRID